MEPATVVNRNLDNVFILFTENLNLVVEKLKDDDFVPRPMSSGFKMEELLSKLGAIVESLSFDATKVAMAFKTPPLPSSQESKQLLSDAEGRAVALVSLYYGVPVDAGNCLRKAMKKFCISVVSGFKDLLLQIKNDRYQSSQELLSSTGTVWAACERFTAAPKNNRDAALAEIQSEMGLVKDALDEVEEAQSSDGGGVDEFMEDLEAAFRGEEPNPSPTPRARTEQEKAVLVPIMGLTKACKNCLKKVRGAIKENGSPVLGADTMQLDEIVTAALRISPSLDELVSGIYSPINLSSLENNGILLTDAMHKLLDVTQGTHVCTEGDIQWLDFLRKATSHNLDQLKNITKQHRGR